MYNYYFALKKAELNYMVNNLYFTTMSPTFTL